MSTQNTTQNPEEFWENLLSREEDLVIKAFSALTQDEQANVKAHLKRMVEEAGWHAEQRISAGCALNFLRSV